MRHLVVRRRVGDVDAGDGVAAVAHVWRHGLVDGVARVALDGVAEVRHGRQRDGHGSRRQVVRVRLGRHCPVSLHSPVRHHHLLWRRRVGLVGEHGGGRIRPLPVFVGGGEEVLVVVLHGRGVLALERRLHLGGGCLPLRLGCLRPLRLGGRALLLVAR